MPHEVDIAKALGRDVASKSPLSGGCVGEVYRVRLTDGEHVVAKVGSGASATLSIEGWMLTYLAERSDLPVPNVMHASDDLLVMEWIDGAGSPSAAEIHAADLLATLHGVDAGHGYGLERDTLIGGLHQPNGWCDSWIEFYAQRRLVEMARQAEEAGRIDASLRRRVESLAAGLARFVDEPPAPSLIHGDVWSGNVLVRGSQVAAFIDPAIYHADAEVELAFIDWLSCFGRGFFDRYQEHRPLRDGFRQRRPVYQLFPQLVHARLFGGGYVHEVSNSLRSLGF